MAVTKAAKSKIGISKKILLRAYDLMCVARRMTEIYDENKEICSKYVHSTSRGHEAIQLAAGMHLNQVFSFLPDIFKVF